MQEFLTNNTVTCNLMSLTGYRTLVILYALIDGPKNNDEINECLLKDQYIKERFSSDTLRIYINSLRAIGCEITRANKLNQKKYELLRHPFLYNIPKTQIKALAKIYKNIHERVSIQDVISIENLFTKISDSIKNKEAKETLQKMSLLKNINLSILNNLLTYCKKKNQITFLYNSPRSGAKEIELIADKLSFKSDKLYLWGDSITHKQYSFFLVDKIIEIRSISIEKKKEHFEPIKVIYEIKSNKYIPNHDEKVIKKTPNSLLVETTSKNKFDLMQKILYHADDCKVISPESFKEELLEKLKTMAKAYEKI